MSHSVFISYRRDGGEISAQMFYELLSAKGYRVFYDIESLGQGLFDENILREIEDCTTLKTIHFGGTKKQWRAIKKYRGWNKNTGNYIVECTDGTISKLFS